MRDIGWVLLAPFGLAAFVILGPLVAVGIVLWTILLGLAALVSYMARDLPADLRRLFRKLDETG